MSGRRVVSAANLAECWKPHIAVPIDNNLDPDAVSAGYGIGWIQTRYRDGTSLVWHNGGIDGFTSFIGFLPEHDIGLVVLNSMNPGPTGLFFYLYVLNLLLSRHFGLNVGVPAKVEDAYKAAVSDLRKLGRLARPVDLHALAPFFWLLRRRLSTRAPQARRSHPPWVAGHATALARRELRHLRRAANGKSSDPRPRQ